MEITWLFLPSHCSLCLCVMEFPAPFVCIVRLNCKFFMAGTVYYSVQCLAQCDPVLGWPSSATIIDMIDNSSGPLFWLTWLGKGRGHKEDVKSYYDVAGADCLLHSSTEMAAFCWWVMRSLHILSVRLVEHLQDENDMNVKIWSFVTFFVLLLVHTLAPYYNCPPNPLPFVSECIERVLERLEGR